MAVVQINYTKGNTDAYGVSDFTTKGVGDPVASVPSVPSRAAVIADVATLVADGASPTQAHVTTLNTDWGTLNTALTTLATNLTALTTLLTGDLTIALNTTNITTVRQALAALRKAQNDIQFGGYGGLSQ